MAKSQRGSPRYTVRLPKPLEARLKAHMEERGIEEASPVIRAALEEYLTRAESQKQEPA